MTVPERPATCGHCYEANRDVRLALSAAHSFVQSARVLLTALTQHPEFAYNRAAIFVVQDDHVRGYAALGVEDPDGAAEFVQARHNDFTRALSAISETAVRHCALEHRVRELTTPLAATDHPLVRAIRTQQPEFLPEGLTELATGPPTGAGIVFPLFARGHAYAAVYADRGFGFRDPTETDMWRASALGNMVDDFGNTDELRIPTIAEPVGILAERMLTVTRLSMRLAHLARNPLAVVGGFSHHLASRVGDSAPTRKALDAIIQNTLRLEDLIDDIPAYALSPESEPSEVDLRDVVEDGIRSLPRECRWRLQRPPERLRVVTYAGIVAACVYIVGRYLGSEGSLRIANASSNGNYDICFCSDHFAGNPGPEMLSVSQLIRMIGGSSQMEAEDHERRFTMTIPQFVHCPITSVEKVERF